MDLYFDEVPSTSAGISPSVCERDQMTEDTDQLRGASSNITSVTPEHRTRSLNPSLIIDELSKSVQELVEKTNDRRTADQKVLEDFQEKTMETVSAICQQMKEQLYSVYEDNNSKMQVKLQELTDVLERCTKLNQELQEAGQALAGLSSDMPASDF